MHIIVAYSLTAWHAPLGLLHAGADILKRLAALQCALTAARSPHRSVSPAIQHCRACQRLLRQHACALLPIAWQRTVPSISEGTLSKSSIDRLVSMYCNEIAD